MGRRRSGGTPVATPDALLDNLIADKKAVPMIVVIPNGRALADDSARGNNFAPEKVAGFARHRETVRRADRS